MFLKSNIDSDDWKSKFQNQTFKEFSDHYESCLPTSKMYHELLCQSRYLRMVEWFLYVNEEYKNKKSAQKVFLKDFLFIYLLRH